MLTAEENPVVHVIAWHYDPENRDAILARFKETGGLPPAGVKMIGRWHGVGTNKGFCVAEGNDPITLAKRAQAWSDLMKFDIYPVVTDADMAQILSCRWAFNKCLSVVFDSAIREPPLRKY